MKQVLFATSNQTKAKRFRKGLLEKGIETLTLKDINIKLDVEENGKTAIENALIKARAYYEKTHIPTIGMDDTLYIENIDDNLQPGLFVRRVNGKTLNDEEMITYYTNLVKKYGVNGRLNCKWIYGLALIDDEGKESTGNIKLNKDLKKSIEGKDVLIVEDIIDTGRTLNYLIGHLLLKKPASLSICTLLSKPSRRIIELDVNYVGFSINDEFVVGYGLDLDQKYRNLPYIGTIEE